MPRTLSSLPPTPVVLLTGFGPFPGMPENVSASLVRAVAKHARCSIKSHKFHATILPTEWSAAPDRVTALLSRLRPTLSLHFGVAHNADGFRIETQGANVCRLAPDAVGREPRMPVLLERGPSSYSASLPVDAIVKRLRALSLPVSVSHDAGGYLCNAVLYHALASQAAPSRVGFIHIPTDLSGPMLTFDVAIQGSLEIIQTALGH